MSGIRTSKHSLMRSLAVILLALILAGLGVMPAFAQEEQGAGKTDTGKTVRVGWYVSAFNISDASGRRSGYAYEYQQKIAAYTGWNYEYVQGSWSKLMQMLKDGEIDLMSDVSYTEERSEQMLFPSLPMGTEKYSLFIAPGSKKITAEDYTTLNGKKVGVEKGSIQRGFFLDWEKKQDIHAKIIDLTGSVDDYLRLLREGELDALVTLDSYGDANKVMPIAKIGSSDIYFAVNKNRPDLLNDLDAALDRIQDENSYYNLQLSEKYLKASVANLYLSEEEKKWITKHGPIRVGYQDNYLAFCAADKKTGELTGALKDYLEYASGQMENAHLEFQAISYPTAADAIDAMKEGEVDCVFPANFTEYDGETMGVAMTPALMRTEMYAVVRAADKKKFAHQKTVKVAVNEGNPNYEMFLQENFPDWRIVRFVDTPTCLTAVAESKADCLLISNYRFNNIARLCEKLKLDTVSTGVHLDYCFAVDRGDTNLYSILTKTTHEVPSSVINAALTYYSTEDAKVSFTEYIKQNLAIVLAVLAGVLLIILLLILRSRRAEKQVSEGQRLISATETDELTGLYNKNFFFEYAARMYGSRPDKPMDAIVMNIEQFHSINELNGREFGDNVLRELGDEIRAYISETEGIASRFEADRFDLYCRHVDDYQALFDRMQGRLNMISCSATIRLRMGVMPWQANLEPVLMFDHARTACSMARGHYKEHLIVFDETLQEREAFEQRLLNDLRRGIEEKEFVVYYQPKYNIQSQPARIVSAEALVRWQHPELGMIPPGDFVPLFERNGQIAGVDRFVWEEVASQIARWRDQYGVTIPVSINLSRVDLFDAALEDTLEKLVEENKLDRKLLKLEVTESAYTENAEQVISVIKSLREKGYEVEMDDFGSGYSSLNMLSSMPIDVLKMDRAFVMNIEHDEKDAQLVALILDIARMLDVPVVAEGVETESQLALLKELGCALVQGYYFSQPMPSEEFEKKIVREGLCG